MREHYGSEPERRGRMVVKSGRQQGHVQVRLPEEKALSPGVDGFCTVRLPIQQARMLGQLLLDACGAPAAGERRVRVSVPSVTASGVRGAEVSEQANGQPEIADAED